MSRSHDTKLIAELVAEVLSLAEWRSEDRIVESVCSDHPHLVERVRDAVELAESIPALHQTADPTDPRIGSLLQGRYSIQRRIGSGAMGAVYVATDGELKREVAVKFMHSGLLGREKSQARFEREIAALAAVRHDAVVQIFDRGVTHDDSPFLVMEHVEGVPLSEILALATSSASGRDATDWLATELGIQVSGEQSFLRLVLRWGADLAAGLSAIHGRGIYHRDVKPSNIMIRFDGSVVLLDFGIADVDDLPTLTRSSEAIGTPAYMAPEALKGKVDEGAGLDVYGLAATLYHGVTLNAPYSGSPSDIFTALATREPRRATKVRPGLPVDVQAILDAGLARSVHQRYSTAQNLERDLRSHLAHEPISVRPVSQFARGLGRVVRSRATWTAAAVALLATAAWARASWNDHAFAQSKDRHSAAYLVVPANLCLVSPANRKTVNADARVEIVARLTRVIDAGYRPEIFLGLRAAYLADQGDFDGASSDALRVASAVSSPLTEALHRLYGGLSNERPSISGDDVKGLPAAETAEGHYLLGLHALRTGGLATAEEALNHASLDGVRYVEELRVLFDILELNAMERRNEQDRLLVEGTRTLRRIEGLEARYGSRSAQSAHLLTAVLNRLRRWEDVGAVAKDGSALSTLTHVTVQNGAHAAERMGQAEDALRFSEYALDQVPGYLPLVQVQARALGSLGRWDEARQLALAEFERNGQHDTGNYRFLVARLLLSEAVELVKTDHPKAQRKAEAALEELSHVSADNETRALLTKLAKSVASANRSGIFTAYLRELTERPEDDELLNSVAKFLPESLDDEQSALVIELIRELRSLRSRAGRTVTYGTAANPDQPVPKSIDDEQSAPSSLPPRNQ